jgi:tRNA (adenine22-N1)-methyltransferase
MTKYFEKKIPKLSPRLAAVTGLVRPGASVADIGTDHAYLPVYLVNSGICPKAEACDVRRGPLLRAQMTVAAYGAGDRVTLLLRDGLRDVPRADDVVIAGMGGELIANIIAPCEFAKDPTVSLVLQPMTSAPELRSFLCLSGFEIKREVAAREGDRLYIAMTAVYTGITFRPDKLFCLTGLLPREGGKNERDYLMKEAARLEKIAQGLKNSALHAGEAGDYDALAREIRAFADGGARGE